MNLEKLVKIRKEAGYTQQMLASHFGFTRQNWSAKERGLQHFRLSEIKELKELLGLSKDEIYDIFIGDWLGGIYDIRLSILRRGIKQKRSS